MKNFAARRPTFSIEALKTPALALGALAFLVGLGSWLINGFDTPTRILLAVGILLLGVFIAIDPESQETLGVARAIFDPDATRAEFAILVRSDQKGHGLGHALLDKLVRYSRARGATRVVGQVLPDNRPMLDLAESLGFRRRFVLGEGVVEVELALA